VPAARLCPPPQSPAPSGSRPYSGFYTKRMKGTLAKMAAAWIEDKIEISMPR
jgi:hypothetical protein